MNEILIYLNPIKSTFGKKQGKKNLPERYLCLAGSHVLRRQDGERPGMDGILLSVTSPRMFPFIFSTFGYF